MPAAKHNVLPVDWEEIRRACEAGLTLSEAARRWNIDCAAVRMRSMREKWIHPAKVERLAAKLKEQKAAALPTVTESTQPPEKTSSLTAEQAVTESVAEMGSQLKSVVMRGTLAALKRANLAALPIESWGDAKTAVEVGLKVSGLEANAGPSLNVLFTGAQAPLVEIDALESVPRGTIDAQEPADIL
jgi:hypothetical protein